MENNRAVKSLKLNECKYCDKKSGKNIDFCSAIILCAF